LAGIIQTIEKMTNIHRSKKHIKQNAKDYFTDTLLTFLTINTEQLSVPPKLAKNVGTR